MNTGEASEQRTVDELTAALDDIRRHWDLKAEDKPSDPHLLLERLDACIHGILQRIDPK